MIREVIRVSALDLDLDRLDCRSSSFLLYDIYSFVSTQDFELDW